MEAEKQYNGRKVLITGGLGFMGSSLAHRLAGLGADVTLVDNFLPGHGANMRNIHGIEDSVRLNLCDLRDEHVMNRIVRNKDIIFHIAAQTSHTDSMKDPFLDVDINCRGNIVFLEAVKNNNPDARVVYTSTRAVYGAPVETPATEDTRPNPVDIYGVNKYAAEEYHKIYGKAHGIPYVIMRFSNSYGPRAQIEHHKFGILNWFVGLVLSGRQIKIFGDGAQLRDYTYIDDMLDAFILAGVREEAVGKVYNVSAGDRIKFIDMVETMIEVAGQGSYELVPWPDEYKKIEVGDFVADSERIKSELGWKPVTGLRDGLAETFDYFRANLDYYLPR